MLQVSNLRGFFSGSLMAVDVATEEISFSGSTFVHAAAFKMKLASQFVLKFETNRVLEPASFDFDVFVQSAKSLENGRYALRNETVDSTVGLFRVASERDKAWSLVIDLLQGQSEVTLLPADSLGNLHATAVGSFWASRTCKARVSCRFTSNDRTGAWSFVHQGISRFCTSSDFSAGSRAYSTVCRRSDLSNSLRIQDKLVYWKLGVHQRPGQKKQLLFAIN